MCLLGFKCQSGNAGWFFRVSSWGSMFSVVPTICFGFQVRVNVWFKSEYRYNVAVVVVVCLPAVPRSLHSHLQQHGEPEALPLGGHLHALHDLLPNHLHSHWSVHIYCVHQVPVCKSSNHSCSLYVQVCTAS